MSTRDLILNIAVNLGRIGRWAHEKKYDRINQFFLDTDYYVEQLKKARIGDKAASTLIFFEQEYSLLRKSRTFTDEWAERAFTLSNILTHRAKLA